VYATRDSRLASHAGGARRVAYLGGHITKENLRAIFLLRLQHLASGVHGKGKM